MIGISFLLGLGIVVGPWVCVFILFSRTKKLRAEINYLAIELSRRRSLIPSTRTKPQEPTRPEPAPEAESPAEPETPTEPEPAEEPEPPIPAVAASQPAAPQPASKPIPEKPTEDLEQKLASRWLIWLGAIAICFSGIFLTAYAAEQGWLGPTARIVLGFLLGLVLAVAGEWVRRRPFQQAIAAIRPDYVPLALSAAGVSIMYASIYTGSALFALYPPLIAFIALAAIGFGAVALALLQGPFVALLGLFGSFLTPMLIPSESPSVWALFPYLLAVLAAGMALVHFRAWWLLGVANLLGASAWCLMWLSIQYTPTDAPAIALFILVFCAIFQVVRFGYPKSERPFEIKDGADFLLPQEALSWAGLLATAILLFVFVRIDGYTTVSLATVGIFSLASLWLARKDIVFDVAFVLAAMLTLSLFATWHLDTITNRAWAPIAGLPTLIEVPELRLYATTALIFGAIFGAGGFLALWTVKRVGLIVGTSILVPLCLLAIAYWRFLDFGQDIRWSTLSLALAVISALAVSIVERHRERELLRLATGLYAVAVIAFISFGMVMAMKEAWLTVALSLQLPAIAWVHQKLKVNQLRTIAGVVAAAVLVRLVFNQNILDYTVQDGLFNWILYGYGIPGLAFFFAARLFLKDTRDWVVHTLENGAIVFLVLLITFQIRLWVTGALDARYDSLLEQSLQSIAWATIGYCQLKRAEKMAAAMAAYFANMGGQILISLAALQVFAMQLIWNNPLNRFAEPIGYLPIFNTLFLAYLIPAGFAFAMIPICAARGKTKLVTTSFVAGLFLSFVFVSFEVKHWFQGDTLSWAFESASENYAISVAWLVFALSLLAGGILFKKAILRYASLTILLITVLKVFAADMAGLTDLYRVASFLGLGLSLVGIGYIYQRYVFVETAKAAAPPEEPE